MSRNANPVYLLCQRICHDHHWYKFLVWCYQMKIMLRLKDCHCRQVIYKYELLLIILGQTDQPDWLEKAQRCWWITKFVKMLFVSKQKISINNLRWLSYLMRDFSALIPICRYPKNEWRTQFLSSLSMVCIRFELWWVPIIAWPSHDFLNLSQVRWHQTNLEQQVLRRRLIGFDFFWPADRGIEPGTAGWEAQTLPLCYAVPQTITW